MLQHLGSSAPPPRRRPPRAPQRSTSGYPGFKAWERLRDEPLVYDFGRFCHHFCRFASKDVVSLGQGPFEGDEMAAHPRSVSQVPSTAPQVPPSRLSDSALILSGFEGGIMAVLCCIYLQM